MRNTLYFLVCLLSLLYQNQNSYAQKLLEVDPSVIGLSDQGVKSLDSFMMRYTQPDRFPCTMLMVTRDGKTGYWKAFGVRDLDSKIKLDRNDLFRIYSITKPITAVAILILWEEGLLGLDDPVEKYIPSFSKIKVYKEGKGFLTPERKITIRHLLNFSSGITYGAFEPMNKADSIVFKANLMGNAKNLEDLVEGLSDLPIVNEPGDAASYGYQTDVLGRIAEVVSGVSLDVFFNERIFKPLGMKETSFVVPEHLLSRYISLYWIDKAGSPTRSDMGDRSSNFYKPTAERSYLKFLSGGGGLVSTPTDYLQFALMLSNKGILNGKRILKASTVDMMTSPNHIGDISRQNALQGYGWLPGFQVLVSPDIKSTTGGGHDGLYWMAGAANLFFWVDPATNIVALIWAQALPLHVFPLFNDTRKIVHQFVK
jgi:CubicO group peptidase (beta-lactamase class C family)